MLLPLRCPNRRCNALLAMIELGPGSLIEIKCRNCNMMVRQAEQPLTVVAP